MSRRAIIAVLAGGCRFGFTELPVPDARTQDSGDAASACVFTFGAGRQHLAAVFPDASARVWGYGAYGQIGDGEMLDRPTPTPVPLPSAVVSAGGGRYETCAALDTGAAYCWGEGDSGQLGDGNGTTSATPVAVANLTGVVEIAPAAVHACARKSDGTVWCWGAGSNGRLGRGSTMSSLVPVQATISNVTRVSAGGSTSCAILADGSPRCWGYNQEGGVGVNSRLDVLTPTQPMNLAKVKAIIPRDVSTCAVRDDGVVLCWGGNDVGQCGREPIGTDILVPEAVHDMAGAGLGAAIDVGLGIDHGCALLSGGEVWCWGNNNRGQLGTGAIGPVQPYATRVIGLPPIVHLGVAAFTTCGLDADGGVWCWGLGLEGELGDGTFTPNQPTPTRAFTACP